MTTGRTWTTASVCLGAGSLAVSVWSLSVLLRVDATAPSGFLRALLLTPVSLLLVVAGVACALLGLVRTGGARALVGIGVCLVAMLPAVTLLIVALGRFTVLVWM